jgi:hypothetical protein
MAIKIPGQQSGGDATSQSEYIEGSEHPVFTEVAQGNFKITGEHVSTIF